MTKALLGKACFPDDHPNCTGGVGLLGAAPSQDALEACDTLLIVGSTFPYIEFYPKPGRARGVQIDRDGQRLGLRYPVECGLLGDARATLTAMIPLLSAKADRSFLTGIRRRKGLERLLAKRGAPGGTPMRGDVAVEALSPLLQDGAIVTTDCGINTAYAARHLKIRSGMMLSTSGTLASMGAGLPYAIAAKIAHPKRQVVSVVGDGGLTMLIGEMATAKKYGAAVKLVVLKNNSLGQIKWEQMAFLGNPEYACDLQPVDFAAVARGFGITAFTLDDPNRAGAVVEEALRHNGPVLIEAVVDPYTPPLPPKITSEQALHFAESVAKGTPERGRVSRRS